MGKVVQLLTHPSELKAVIQLKGFREHLHKRPEQSENLSKCYDFLFKTSRSFATVIEELHPELKDAIMLFYLILRALDTIEDDMSIDSSIKVPILRSFASKLDTNDWSYQDSKDKDAIVLAEFPVILAEYHRLKPAYQDILKDITDKMGNGMADYILDENFNLNGVETLKDYDLYCHYVAGLVGEGLTKLMVLAGFANNDLMDDDFQKTESMGLFLQKTNIIRDYHEDLLDGRSFWPKEVWSKYTDNLPSFHKDLSEQSQTAGINCINELVYNSLSHVIDVLTYLSMVKDPSSFNFCAIPQVMAIASLALVYNNKDVLHKNVKIRKGTTCKLILASRTMPAVASIFKHYIQVINHKSRVEDPNYLKIGIRCGQIEQFIESMYPTPGSIPAGATASTDSSEISTYIKARSPIDRQVSQEIQREEFRCNAAILSVLLVIGATIYYFVK